MTGWALQNPHVPFPSSQGARTYIAMIAKRDTSAHYLSLSLSRSPSPRNCGEHRAQSTSRDELLHSSAHLMSKFRVCWAR